MRDSQRTAASIKKTRFPLRDLHMQTRQFYQQGTVPLVNKADTLFLRDLQLQRD